MVPLFLREYIIRTHFGTTTPSYNPIYLVFGGYRCIDKGKITGYRCNK